MKGALGQLGKQFSVIRDKPNLSGLLEAGKIVQERPHLAAPFSSSGRRVPQEPAFKPEVAILLYQAIGEEFSSERQMKRYLSKMKKVKEIKRIPEESEKITTDTA